MQVIYQFGVPIFDHTHVRVDLKLVSLALKMLLKPVSRIVGILSFLIVNSFDSKLDSRNLFLLLIYKRLYLFIALLVLFSLKIMLDENCYPQLARPPCFIHQALQSE